MVYTIPSPPPPPWGSEGPQGGARSAQQEYDPRVPYGTPFMCTPPVYPWIKGIAACSL